MSAEFQTVRAELVATVLHVAAQIGDPVDPSDMLVLLDSMKMEIPVMAESSGTVTEIFVVAGETVREGDALAIVSLAS
ncbi:MAG: biotin/lipoyl attachment protein [Frankiales bacterium]|nr:biotin/lipoyl attachment protein [Frankiales bacterium]